MKKYIGVSLEDLKQEKKNLKRFEKGVKKGIKKLNDELAIANQERKEINKIIKAKQ